MNRDRAYALRAAPGPSGRARSARPVGSGTGAARRFRRAVAGLAVLLGGAFALPAFGGGLDTDTWDACEHSTAVDAALDAELQAMGWEPVTRETKAEFRAVLADGLLASSAALDGEKVDWLEERKATFEVAGRFSQNVGHDQIKLYYHPDQVASALVVYPHQGVHPTAVHCIFAGVASKETLELLDTLAEMDALAGRRQANPELQIATVDTTGPANEETGKRVVVSAVYGRFREPIEVPAGRPLRVDFGFSLIRTLR